MRYEDSISKIKRAKQHIKDIESALLRWVMADDFHTVFINHDFRRKLVYLRIRFDELTFPASDIALIIGDALHNLRSALDLMWYQIILDCDGKPSDWTKFPVYKSREKLMGAVNSALKQKQITLDIAGFVVYTIKPYQTGNDFLCALHRLNIRDKHELLIPLLQLVRFDDIHLEDEQGTRHLADKFYVMDQASSFRLDRYDIENPWDKKFTIKDKGHATATIIFNLDVPLQGEAVIPSLYRIAEEVTRTVEAFDVLLWRGLS